MRIKDNVGLPHSPQIGADTSLRILGRIGPLLVRDVDTERPQVAGVEHEFRSDFVQFFHECCTVRIRYRLNDEIYAIQKFSVLRIGNKQFYELEDVRGA